MARRVSWTEQARQDLAHEADYIAKDSKHYAAVVVRQARDVARSLRDWAERGAILDDLGDPSIRQTLVGNYRLIYQVLPRKIYILAFVHGARDLLAFWHRERRAPRTD